MANTYLQCAHACGNTLSVTPHSQQIRCTHCQKTTQVPANHYQQQQPISEKQYTEHCRICSSLKKLKNMMGSEKGSSYHQLKPYESLNYVVSDGEGGGASRHKKRALLIGVSYKKQRYKLKGTIYDVLYMRTLLIDTFKFPKESIRVLTEEEKDPHFTPTRKNIQEALQWLVQDCQPGDSLVFYYSGHGLRQFDFNQDERDGFDETLCPVDFKKEGMILDNDINTTIVRPLKKGVTLHAIVDACHSGTILDLIHVYDRKKKEWVDNSPPSGAEKGTDGGLAICFSACEDHQLAADTSALSGNVMSGAMTYSLISALKTKSEPTYGELLDSMQEAIDNANKSGCFHGHLKKIFRQKIFQIPQLSSSEKFEVDKKTFKL